MRRAWRTLMLSSLSVAVVAAASGVPGRTVSPAPPPVAVPAVALNELWNDYGDQGGHWTGGDRTVSVPLPDGRTGHVGPHAKKTELTWGAPVSRRPRRAGRWRDRGAAS